MSIEKNISEFWKQIENDKNHRFKSWEHCFLYFLKPEKDIDIQFACLHLSFYLASWGMYRGSSFLIWKDYLIHSKVVEEILKHKRLQNICFDEIDEESQEIKELFELIAFIKNWYPENIKLPEVDGKIKKINVTDTLVTKIILGTLGCIPAYDQYFKKGLKIKGIKPHTKLSERNYLELIKFYKNNKNEFHSIQNSIYKESSLEYPIMKLIDMYFLNIGTKNTDS